MSAKEAAMAAGQGAAKTSIRVLNWLLLPIATLGLIGHFILLGSGLTIILACIFLPVAAGMLAFSPEQGGGWIGRIIAAIVGALLVTAFLPIIFKAAFDLTVVQPIKAVNAEFSEFGDYYNAERLGTPPTRLQEIDAELETLNTRYADLGETFGDRLVNIGERTGIEARTMALSVERLTVLGDYHLGHLDKLNNALSAVANEIMRWASRLLFMFIGVFMGSSLIWWGARATAQLVGGMVGREVGNLAKMGGSQVMGFASGGGRGGTAPSSHGGSGNATGGSTPSPKGSPSPPSAVHTGVSDGGGRKESSADSGVTFARHVPANSAAPESLN